MFIELTEFLRCPFPHEGKTYGVLVPHDVHGRDVVAGVVACPECRREFPIVGGVADLRHPDDAAVASRTAADGRLPPVASVHALLGLEGPGGYVVLVGSASRLAAELSALLDGTHLVLVDPSQDAPPPAASSVLLGGRQIPLHSAMARGVVVGTEHARTPWLPEAARVLLPGLRLVVLAENVDVRGIEPLAAGHGMLVGRRV